MIEIDRDELVFGFPHLGDGAECRIHFQRTLRIPDTDKTYPLPPGFGRFPLRHTEDLKGLPDSWTARGGVALPMWQAEALWIAFGGWGGPPFAVKVAAGKVCAVTGKEWAPSLSQSPQDYLPRPSQPWLDGFSIAKGVIRQFVATRLGLGATVEEQVRGTDDTGGLQILVVPPTEAVFAAWQEEQQRLGRKETAVPDSLLDVPIGAVPCAPRAAAPMGLGAGGRMKQEIVTDVRPLSDYDQDCALRVFVALIDAVTWKAATGEVPPTPPPSARDYARAGLPWFDWYGGDVEALGGSSVLAGVKTVGEVIGDPFGEPDVPTPPPVVLGKKRRRVRDWLGL